MAEIDLDRAARDLYGVAYSAWRMTLIGDPPPFIEEESRRCLHPKAGDAVIEISHFDPGLDADAIGTLVVHDDGIWTIRPYGRSDEISWGNGHFVGIPGVPTFE